MEVKIQCGCGTKYKFDVQPVNGRMPVAVACPGCGASGTELANLQLGQLFPSRGAVPTNLAELAIATPAASPVAAPGAPAPAPAPVATMGGLRVASASLAMEEPPATHGAHGSGPRGLLQRTTFFVKERTSLLKLTDTYDILDPASGQQIGIAKEQPPTWAKWLRLAVEKHKLPTAINIYEQEGQPPVLSVKRGFTFIRSKLRVVAGDGRALGYFRSKLISIGGGFHVFDHADQQVAEVKGNWKGWDFKFLTNDGRQIGTVTKKWAGLGKELFTSADNYIISLTNVTGSNPDAAALLLAAGLAIDVVFKEDE